MIHLSFIIWHHWYKLSSINGSLCLQTIGMIEIDSNLNMLRNPFLGIPFHFWTQDHLCTWMAYSMGVTFDVLAVNVIFPPPDRRIKVSDRMLIQTLHIRDYYISLFYLNHLDFAGGLLILVIDNYLFRWKHCLLLFKYLPRFSVIDQVIGGLFLLGCIYPCHIIQVCPVYVYSMVLGWDMFTVFVKCCLYSVGSNLRTNKIIKKNIILWIFNMNTIKILNLH